MKQSLAYGLVVRDYDESLEFLCRRAGLQAGRGHLHHGAGQTLGGHRTARIRESSLLLAQAVNAEQSSRIGNQTGGRVFLFLHTDDFWRDYHAYKARGVIFVREPKKESYGTVAVFKDLYGNQWDLVQPLS